MPSESERWKTGAFRNTVGTTEGATGAVTGDVTGHVKSEPLDKKDHDALRKDVAKEVDKPTFTGG